MYPKSKQYFPFHSVPAVYKNHGFTDDRLFDLLTKNTQETVPGHTIQDRASLLNNGYNRGELSTTLNYCKKQATNKGIPYKPEFYAGWFVIYFLKYTSEGMLCTNAFKQALADVKLERYKADYPVRPHLHSTIKTEHSIQHDQAQQGPHKFLYAYQQYQGANGHVAGMQAANPGFANMMGQGNALQLPIAPQGAEHAVRNDAHWSDYEKTIAKALLSFS